MSRLGVGRVLNVRVGGVGKRLHRALPGWLREAVSITGEVLRESREDRVNGLAAEVAFFGVLSVFPGLLMLAAGLGSLEVLVGNRVAGRAQELLLDFLERVLTSEAAGLVEAVRHLFEQSRGQLFTLATLVALWGLSRGFNAVIVALNLAYDVTERRNLLKRRLEALLLALGGLVVTVVVIATIVVGPLLGRGQRLADVLGLGQAFAFAWVWLRWPVAFAALIAWTAVLYHVAPNLKTRWRAGLPGAVLAALLWLVVSLGFARYLRIAGAGNQVLGVVGGGLILLLWLYLLALALLVGGELNAVLLRRRESRRR